MNGDSLPDLKIVSSHYKEDVSWLDDNEYPYLVVSKGDEIPKVRNFLKIPNRGLEFGSYIWYLLSHWDHLPERIAFIHGHRDSYHQQFLTDQSVSLFAASEFACLNGHLSCAIHRLDGVHPWFGQDFREMWNFMGLNSVCLAPSIASMQPSTQSVVSKNLIRSRGRAFWERIFHCLMVHEAHRHLALVMEIAWPMIFGANSNDGPLGADEFFSFFDQRNLSVLIAHPKEVWHSLMPNTVKFAVPDSKKSWISLCMKIFEESAKVY